MQKTYPIVMGLLLLTVATIGLAVYSRIEQPFEVQPAVLPEYYTSQIDEKSLPEHTGRIYSLIKDGKLAGANATDFADVLEKASTIKRLPKTTFYGFRTANFDRDVYEGEPFIYLLVQNKYGLIFRCGVGAPEF